AAAAAPGIDLRLDHPAPQRRLGQVELTRHGADTLPALPHHPDRFRLELRRERSPPPLLPHASLLSHFSCGSECLRNPGKPSSLTPWLRRSHQNAPAGFYRMPPWWLAPAATLFGPLLSAGSARM